MDNEPVAVTRCMSMRTKFAQWERGIVAGARREKAASRRRAPMRAARLADTLLDRALKSKGFAQVEVVKRWRDIVGPELSKASMPLQLRFPRGERTGGTLVVRVEGAFAPLLQHRQHQVVERVNSHFGFNAVAKLALEQGPISRKPRPVLIKRPLSAEESAHLNALVSEDGESEVRAALRRLGEAVLTRRF